MIQLWEPFSWLYKSNIAIQTDIQTHTIPKALPDQIPITNTCGKHHMTAYALELIKVKLIPTKAHQRSVTLKISAHTEPIANEQPNSTKIKWIESTARVWCHTVTFPLLHPIYHMRSYAGHQSQHLPHLSIYSRAEPHMVSRAAGESRKYYRFDSAAAVVINSHCSSPWPLSHCSATTTTGLDTAISSLTRLIPLLSITYQR